MRGSPTCGAPAGEAAEARRGPRALRGWASLSLVACAAGLAACVGNIGGTETEGPGASGGSGGPGPDPQSCSPTADPIRRLTTAEYVNAVAALLPGVPLPTTLPVPDQRTDGFVGQAAGQSPSALGVQRYQELAATLGESAAADLAAWAPCTADSADCVQEIGRTLGVRAYRRPLDADETEALDALAASTYETFGMDAAVALVVQGLLESPWFLYRPELGVTGDDGMARLDDWEMASRLSFFFLDSMPDDDLFAAAEAGKLTTDDGLEAEARRLLADGRSRAVITGFFAEWLRLYKIDTLALDAATFPELDEAMRLDLARSAELFLDKAIWEDDAWASLVSGSYGFVNDRLAPIFGVDAPGSDELVLVQLDAQERRGVLTQPALLAATSHGIAHSPIYRGVTMLSSILCKDMPAPPPGILDNFEGVEPEGEVCTTRDKIQKTHDVEPTCQNCHQDIDGAGFVFEAYDALGRYRTEENGCSIDDSGHFPGTLGDVDGAIDLADKLAASDLPATCMAKHLFRYAAGRKDKAGDACEVDALVDAMDETGGSLQETIIHMVLSPAFRSRPNP